MRMDEVEFHREPPTNVPRIVVAFGGWVDAGEAATGAMRSLVRQLAAMPLASIDPEDFCDFTQLRPVVRLTAEGERTIRWPRIAFWTWQPPAGGAAAVSRRRAPATVAHVHHPAPGRGRALWGAAHRVAGRGPRGRAAYPAPAGHGQQHRPCLARTVGGVRDTDTSLALRRPDRHEYGRRGCGDAPGALRAHLTGASAPLPWEHHQSGRASRAADHSSPPARPGAGRGPLRGGRAGLSHPM